MLVGTMGIGRLANTIFFLTMVTMSYEVFFLCRLLLSFVCSEPIWTPAVVSSPPLSVLRSCVGWLREVLYGSFQEMMADLKSWFVCSGIND